MTIKTNSGFTLIDNADAAVRVGVPPEKLAMMSEFPESPLHIRLADGTLLWNQEDLDKSADKVREWEQRRKGKPMHYATLINCIFKEIKEAIPQMTHLNLEQQLRYSYMADYCDKWIRSTPETRKLRVSDHYRFREAVLQLFNNNRRSIMPMYVLDFLEFATDHLYADNCNDWLPEVAPNRVALYEPFVPNEIIFDESQRTRRDAAIAADRSNRFCVVFESSEKKNMTQCLGDVRVLAYPPPGEFFTIPGYEPFNEAIIFTIKRIPISSASTFTSAPTLIVEEKNIEPTMVDVEFVREWRSTESAPLTDTPSVSDLWIRRRTESVNIHINDRVMLSAPAQTDLDILRNIMLRECCIPISWITHVVVEENGKNSLESCRPWHTEEQEHLDIWLIEQRQRYHKGKLDTNKQQMLESLTHKGINWKWS